MSGRVIVAGSINTDLVIRTPRFPVPGETLAGSSFAVSGGGKGANQAIAAARFGASVSFVGSVGDDAYGNARIAAFEAEKIDISQVRRMPETPSGIALILVDDAGSNSIVIIAGANGAVSAALLDQVLPKLVEPGDVVCCQLEVPFAATRRALEIGKQAGAMTVLNAAPGTASAQLLLPLADVLVVNEIEAMQVAGLPVSDSADLAFDRAVDELRRHGARHVVVTLGEHGAVCWSDDTAHAFPAESVDVVDTTGAGDAFVGTLIGLLAEGSSLLDAIPTCIRAGTLAVTRPGAQPSLPYRRELFPS